MTSLQLEVYDCSSSFVQDTKEELITWLQGEYKSDEAGRVLIDEMYDRYKYDYCGPRRREPQRKCEFGKALKRAFPGVKNRRLGPMGKQLPFYCGIVPCTKKTAGTSLPAEVPKKKRTRNNKNENRKDLKVLEYESAKENDYAGLNAASPSNETTLGDSSSPCSPVTPQRQGRNRKKARKPRGTRTPLTNAKPSNNHSPDYTNSAVDVLGYPFSSPVGQQLKQLERQTNSEAESSLLIAGVGGRVEELEDEGGEFQIEEDEDMFPDQGCSSEEENGSGMCTPVRGTFPVVIPYDADENGKGHDDSFDGAEETKLDEYACFEVDMPWGSPILKRKLGETTTTSTTFVFQQEQTDLLEEEEDSYPFLDQELLRPSKKLRIHEEDQQEQSVCDRTPMVSLSLPCNDDGVVLEEQITQEQSAREEGMGGYFLSAQSSEEAEKMWQRHPTLSWVLSDLIRLQ